MSIRIKRPKKYSVILPQVYKKQRKKTKKTRRVKQGKKRSRIGDHVNKCLQYL